MRVEKKINGYSLEICASSSYSAQVADSCGATRIELCQSLELGGTTPSYGLIKSILEKTKLGVYVLIRPRSGDFVYSKDELDEMKADIELCKNLGCSGVVIGALDKYGNVDVKKMGELISVAGSMTVVFHRAFDRCREPLENLQKIIDLGCKRVLTSGLKSTAYQGMDVIKELVDFSDGRIEIMPGAGVNEKNITELMHFTGAESVHSSAKVLSKSSMEYENPYFSEMNEDIIESDIKVVNELINALKKL